MSVQKTAKVHLADDSQCFDFNTGCPSLLDCLEQNKLTVPYQCREGYCGACRATLIDGTVNYNQEPLAFVREGEVLLCCCKPNGSITLSFK
ncbi:ferredoxin [Pseudoalteromonas porphyrae]|uniref:Ferredoxin n=2 Tax=Pseudoalteromonas TaxID=53246 RepID=A0A0N1MVW9_9GAMM|nr:MULTISPECIES: class I ribonucleotide reductase maintenance protein YfaE [Pseudoalteromonas]KPH64306.1 ferredoxin [Pseudoalteromonas porphyrae]KPH96138.1 ferredoxin [Pseudoalteromonas porphyrae]NMR24092.1 2Fe-2S ferredoxin-like protein [Pseudoalteromonas sp. NEC-BIFX-2020_015]NNG43090.1 2Fe-2S ferredoxin-like protein [Pseudoalteromonas sp. NEC-BIFX-2020_002]